MTENERTQNNQAVKIKVFGVGGAGQNTVGSMIDAYNDPDIEYYVCNTDRQALQKSNVPNKIMMGDKENGAGGNPENGRQAAEYSFPKIRAAVSGAVLVFITAGMGGGTGTGASPVIARAAKESGALVIGVVSTPFEFEGKKRARNAQNGIKQLRSYVDGCILVSNNRIVDIYGRIPFQESLTKANEVITTAISSITSLVSANSMINIDLADVRTIMKSDSNAFISTGTSTGENAAKEAAYSAVTSPLLENGIRGAKNAIIHISGGKNMCIQDATEAIDVIEQVAGNQLDIIFGIATNKDMDNDDITVTIIASGVDDNTAEKAKKADTAVLEQKPGRSVYDFNPSAPYEPEHRRMPAAETPMINRTKPDKYESPVFGNVGIPDTAEVLPDVRGSAGENTDEKMVNPFLQEVRRDYNMSM